jgi:hypothetical protein
VNVTLTAFYGDKPEPFAALIREAQRLLKFLGDAFCPYDLRQVHATLFGLEGRVLRDGTILNANYEALRGEARIMRSADVVELVRTSAYLPLAVRIGGYRTEVTYPFSSRGQHPWHRSFSIQGTRAVALGWPVDGSLYPPSLDAFRRDMNRANVLHKYHAKAGDIDNDLFFVLGTVRPGVAEPPRLEATEQRLREFLSSTCVELDVDRHDLQIVGYVDPTLPTASTVSHALSSVDGATLDGLHRATS